MNARISAWFVLYILLVLTLVFVSNTDVMAQDDGDFDFAEVDRLGFIGNYTEYCDESCMGIRLSKDEVYVELEFYMAMDEMLYQCSDTVEYHPLANNWYRIHDSGGIFYSNNAMENSTNEYFNIGEIVPGEWEAVQGKTYKIRHIRFV